MRRNVPAREPADRMNDGPEARPRMPYGPERDSQATLREDADSSGMMRRKPDHFVVLNGVHPIFRFSQSALNIRHLA